MLFSIFIWFNISAKKSRTQDMKDKKIEEKNVKSLEVYECLDKNKLKYNLVKDLFVQNKTKNKESNKTKSVFTDKDFQNFVKSYK